MSKSHHLSLSLHLPSSLPQAEPPQAESMFLSQIKSKRKTAVLADLRITNQMDTEYISSDDEESYYISSEVYGLQELPPMTWQEAMKEDKWKDSMRQEIKALKDNKVWIMVQLPHGRRTMKTKWAYKIKRNSGGEITKLKSRLNACGYSQKEGLDYESTYAPVGSKCLLRTLLAIATYRDYEIKQVDFDSAFLNGKLEHELYMDQPGGFHDGTSRVCKLEKSIYGLKQAASVWYKTLKDLLDKLQFEPSTKDSCLFLRKSGKTRGPEWIFVYVDDLLIIGERGSCAETSIELAKIFKTKDLGNAEFILGIKVTRSKAGMLLNQRAFAEALVDTNMDKALNRSSKSALPINQDSNPMDDEALTVPDSSTYRSIVGATGYLANTTRPDLSVAFSILGTYVCQPTNKSWRLAQCCLTYIHETLDLGLMFRTRDPKSSEVTKLENELKIYSDSDWAGNTGSVSTHRRSRSGTHVTLYGGTID